MNKHTWDLFESDIKIHVPGFNPMPGDIYKCKRCGQTKAVSKSKAEFYQVGHSHDCDIVLVKSVHNS